MLTRLAKGAQKGAVAGGLEPRNQLAFELSAAASVGHEGPTEGEPPEHTALGEGYQFIAPCLAVFGEATTEADRPARVEHTAQIMNEVNAGIVRDDKTSDPLQGHGIS